MKRVLLLAAGLGLILAIAIIAYEGFAAVGAAFAAVGWGLIVIVALRALQLAGAGLGWWMIFPPGSPHPLGACLWVRFIREAINTLLPVAQIGGEIAGARLMTFFGVAGGLAGATVLVDMLLQVVTQFAFTLIGIGFLAAAGANATLVGSMLIGAALMALALAAFFVFQRFGGLKLIERGLANLAEKPGWSALAQVANVHDHLLVLYGGVGRLALASAIHRVVWFVGALEVLVALHLMGYPIDYSEALVIESLGQAVRAAAFLVPGAFGIQEGGFIALCAVYGIAAPAALALSLVKRVPEFVLGLPFLLAWHVHESRALMRGRKPSS
jgi:putative membrane protein